MHIRRETGGLPARLITVRIRVHKASLPVFLASLDASLFDDSAKLFI